MYFIEPEKGSIALCLHVQLYAIIVQNRSATHTGCTIAFFNKPTNLGQTKYSDHLMQCVISRWFKIKKIFTIVFVTVKHRKPSQVFFLMAGHFSGVCGLILKISFCREKKRIEDWTECDKKAYKKEEEKKRDGRYRKICYIYVCTIS